MSRRSLPSPIAGARPAVVLRLLLMVASGWVAHGQPAGREGRLPPFVVQEKIPDKVPPTHLTPIPAYRPDGYIEAVFRTLIGRRQVALSMVRCPDWSYNPEDAVILLHEPFSEPKRWTLEHAAAKEKIWAWDEKARARKPASRGIEAERKVIEVSAEFAAGMNAAWSLALSEVRFPEDEPRVHDANVVFFQSYERFGEASFPGYAGRPALLTKLGNRLIALVHADPSEAERIRAECVALAKQVREWRAGDK